MAESGPILLPYGGVSQSRADTGFGVDYSFTLGAYVEKTDDVDVGDYAEIAQSVDCTGVDLITFKLGGAGVSDGSWKLTVLVGSHTFIDETMTGSTEFDYVRRVLNVTNLTGAQTLKFKLEAL